MHAILARLFERGLDGPAIDGSAVRAVAEEVWQERERGEGWPRGGLAALRATQVVRAVEAFMAWDLEHRGRWVPTWFEAPASGEVGGVRIRAVLDRVDRDPASGRLRIIEYKRRFGDAWKIKLATLARRGRKLQAPLYLSVASAAGFGDAGSQPTEIALYFVENYASDDPSLEAIFEQCHVRRLDAETWTAAEPQISRVVQVFAGLVREGWFFIRPQEGPRGHCARCDFGTVCRKGDARAPMKAERMAALASYWGILRREPRA
jgi:hypothetical protein